MAPASAVEAETPTPPGPANAVDPNAGNPSRLAGPELANRIRQMFFHARDHRRPLMPLWRQNYQTLNMRGMASSNTWPPEPRIAKAWPILSSLVAWMTDQRPMIQVTPCPEPFTPFGEYYQSVANDMNTVIKSNFMTEMLDAEVTQLLWDVGTYGIGWVKSAWEPHLADGMGNSVFRRLDPFTVYPDPFARTPRQMNFIIEAKVVTVDDLDRAFPGAKKLLGMGSQLEDVDEAPHILDNTSNAASPRVNLQPLAPSTSPQYGGTSRNNPGKTELYADVPTVTMLEAWVREHETVATSDPLVKKVLERWRCVVVVGSMVLFDHYADECNAFGTHPYDRMVLFDTGEMYGPSLVHFLKSPQDSINNTLGAIEFNVRLMGNPMIIESPRSESRKKQLSNRPGQRINANPTEVKWLDPPQMQPQIAVQLMSYYESQIETISGLSAIVRGFTPTARNSSGVLDSVQDAAFVRIRATLRELERTLRGVAGKMVATVAEFYTEPRMISLVGDDGQALHRALRGRHFYNLPGTGDSQAPLRFTVLADAGSQMPTSQSARAGDAMTLFGLGAIDHLELLKAMNWPGYAAVAKRVQESQISGALQVPGQRQASRA
jgi:hypothetical protein